MLLDPHCRAWGCLCVGGWGSGGGGSSEREHIVHKVEESSQGHVECALCNV